MKLYTTIVLVFINCALQAQNYPPAAGEEGSTAIAANSDLFKSWAIAVTLERGHVDISNPDFEDNGSNFATYGDAENALGEANNNAVSLGDRGTAILTFETPIADGPSFDFAVFENSFSDTYLELAFVEVSSNGIDYFRFPAHSQTQTEEQVETFGLLDPTYINNLAGKYRALFGTPFDISELEDNPLLDKNSITHIKIIDVVGSIDATYASYDSYGNAINDPFATPFYSSGFDLDAVGVINEQVLGVTEIENTQFFVYPNPVSDKLNVTLKESANIIVYDIQARIIASKNITNKGQLDVSGFKRGVYILQLSSNGKTQQTKFIKN